MVDKPANRLDITKKTGMQICSLYWGNLYATMMPKNPNKKTKNINTIKM